MKKGRGGADEAIAAVHEPARPGPTPPSICARHRIARRGGAGPGGAVPGQDQPGWAARDVGTCSKLLLMWSQGGRSQTAESKSGHFHDCCGRVAPSGSWPARWRWPPTLARTDCGGGCSGASSHHATAPRPHPTAITKWITSITAADSADGAARRRLPSAAVRCGHGTVQWGRSPCRLGHVRLPCLDRASAGSGFLEGQSWGALLRAHPLYHEQAAAAALGFTAGCREAGSGAGSWSGVRPGPAPGGTNHQIFDILPVSRPRAEGPHRPESGRGADQLAERDPRATRQTDGRVISIGAPPTPPRRPSPTPPRSTCTPPRRAAISPLDGTGCQSIRNPSWRSDPPQPHASQETQAAAVRHRLPRATEAVPAAARAQGAQGGHRQGGALAEPGELVGLGGDWSRGITDSLSKLEPAGAVSGEGGWRKGGRGTKEATRWGRRSATEYTAGCELGARSSQGNHAGPSAGVCAFRQLLAASRCLPSAVLEPSFTAWQTWWACLPHRTPRPLGAALAAGGSALWQPAAQLGGFRVDRGRGHKAATGHRALAEAS